MRATLNGGRFQRVRIGGEERPEIDNQERVNLRRYGMPHCSLRQGQEWRGASSVVGNGAEPRALRSAGVVAERLAFRQSV